MNSRLLFVSCVFLFCMCEVRAQVSKTLFVEKPGTLISNFTEEEANSITHLTLTGKINVIDFKHLRDGFQKLEVLDLSNVDIRLYTGKDGTNSRKFISYLPNCIPQYAFCRMENGKEQGKLSLRKVILSEKIKSIEDAAFKGCSNLKVCRIKKKTPPSLQPEALADSITAIFVPLACTDKYRLGKRWETFAFLEGDAKEVYIEVSAMNTLESEIIKSGLQPKEINFLTVAGKLDAADFKLICDYMPNLVSVDISKTNATEIPEFTFTQKKYMLNIKLPKNLKVIGQRAFSGCGRLCGTIELPPSVTAIEYGAFMGCDNLRHVVATGNKITTLGESLFGDSKPSKLIYKTPAN